ncbi:hypothetical protein IJ098_00445 [Candidatus Saccharibacteria bacterium]|nr:hypothetical protein [Candidatus Saccharibacteria bacterium]
MHVICTAVVEDERQRENLCECVRILSCTPNVSGNTVCVEYDDKIAVAEALVDLFKHYPTHGISVLS